MKKNRNYVVIIPLIVFLLAGSACTPLSALNPAEELLHSAESAYTSLSVLNLAEELWYSQEITHYYIKVRHVQSIWHLQTYSMEVSTDLITHSASCIPAPVENGTCEVEEAYDPENFTIEGLFKTARRLLNGENVKWTKVEYDPDYGFPIGIRYDHPDILDEDSTWTVLEFETLD